MFATTTTGSDLPHQKSLEIKEDDKFFSRLLSKETSMSNPSFRVYYGGVTVTVPFMWESQPGTPKYSFCENTLLPPLTPPPSYYSNSSNKSKPPKKPSSRSNLLHILLSRINPNKTSTSTNNISTLFSSSNSSCSASSPSPSSASSWSSWNSTLTRRKYHHERSRFSSSGSGSSFDSRAFNDDDQDIESPTSTLCFGVSRRTRWLQ